jgi:hypothetical protein
LVETPIDVEAEGRRETARVDWVEGTSSLPIGFVALDSDTTKEASGRFACTLGAGVTTI